jgi:hypothetical protein
MKPTTGWGMMSGMSLDGEIVVVSGLPRAGTSLMMQMLSAGGLEVVTDNLRAADVDNPRGYWELEQVKKIKRDATWLPETRGKVFKMVSQLLYDLPRTERYRIIFMQRSLEEVIVSQEKMLKRLNRPAVPHDQMKQAFDLHLKRLFQWLPDQSNIKLLDISYNALLKDPETYAQQVSAFLDGRPIVDRMTEAVDLSLYRNRRLADA